MIERLLIGLTSIVVLGIGAQWLAWRIRLPSILLLLVFGFIAGPVTGLLNPDELLGNLLFPIVSISVALILFEGGLSLKIGELRVIGKVVRNLISIGALVTWSISACAAHFILGIDVVLSVLSGAIMVVSGPTVIVPLLRQVRPIRQLDSVLRWEGILIDPIGAMLAVLVFEGILAGSFQEASVGVVTDFFKTILIGGGIGVLGAGLMFMLLQRHWIPDFLQSPVSLMMVFIVFTLSNLLKAESGLLTVTVMGIVLANQKTVAVRHIIEFKENLRVLLIATLFIILSARLQLSDLANVGISSLAFLCVLVFVARPAAVALSTIRSGLSWRERVFLSCVNPRGIVAAAVSSIFALRLSEAGYMQAEVLVPLTFLVIIGTVSIYGLTAIHVARWLSVAQPNPQGVLIVGAHSWAREIASAVKAQGYQVLLVDNNWANATAARNAGLQTYYGNILSEYSLYEIELGGIGHLLALTYNDAVNSLAAIHFADSFGRKDVYQLPPSAEKTRKDTVPKHLRGRLLFGQGVTYTYLASRFTEGAVIKTTHLTEEFDYDAFKEFYGETAIPLFLITEGGDLLVFTIDSPPKPRPGQTLISLVNPVEETPTKTQKPSGANNSDEK